MRYDTVIFDLDGTLLDTIGDITNCANHTLALYGFEPKTYEEIKTYIGYGIDYFLERAYPPGRDDERYEDFVRDYKAYYLDHMTDKTIVYPGMYELLDELKKRDIKLGVVTNKFHMAASLIVEHFFSGTFGQVIGEGMGYAKKPDPETLNAAIEGLDADKAKTLYIGDSEADITISEGAGVDCLIVTWGMRSREFMEKYEPKPRYMIDDIKDFFDAVENS